MSLKIIISKKKWYNFILKLMGKTKKNKYIINEPNIEIAISNYPHIEWLIEAGVNQIKETGKTGSSMEVMLTGLNILK